MERDSDLTSPPHHPHLAQEKQNGAPGLRSLHQLFLYNKNVVTFNWAVHILPKALVFLIRIPFIFTSLLRSKSSAKRGFPFIWNETELSP